VHDGRLVLAAGGEGLLIVDVTDPDAPTRAATVALDGPALDVFVDGDLAWVSTGQAGIAVVDLVGARVLRTMDVPGFVAGVTVDRGVAYAAACESVVSLDAETGEILGEGWLPADQVWDENGVLVAPAKDVVVSGDRLFVAAGRWGAVEMDILEPAAPAVVGNCTEVEHLGFYASGLRQADGRLFVAAGEWGILPVDLGGQSACPDLHPPQLIPPAPDGDADDEGEECTTEPPWEVLSWEETWLPPVVPNQDPLQTLPVGEVLYAFGDATRIGMRAVDVRLSAAQDLEKIGRYEEPRVASGISAHGDRVLVVGREGGLFVRDGATLTLDEASPDARQAIEGGFLDDGRWVLAHAEPRRLQIEGSEGEAVLPTGEGLFFPGTMATAGSLVILSEVGGATIYDADSMQSEQLVTTTAAMLPAAVAYDESGSVILAAPEWTEAVRVERGSSAETWLHPHGIFGQQEAASVTEWRAGLPRRLLEVSPLGLVELATLGRRAGVALHVFGQVPESVELPPGEYVDLASDGSRVYAVSIDRGTYRSQLVTLDLSVGSPRIVAVDTWTGMAAGVAVTTEGVFVADRDEGVRIYDAGPGGVSLAGVVVLGAEASR
jgi:hypothetical protein